MYRANDLSILHSYWPHYLFLFLFFTNKFIMKTLLHMSFHAYVGFMIEEIGFSSMTFLVGSIRNYIIMQTSVSQMGIYGTLRAPKIFQGGHR